MKPAAVVLARLSSSRLPGKVLTQIGDQPLLELTLDRVRRSRHVGPHLVATSDEPTDDAIAEWCRSHQVDCFRGALDDVARRALDAARSIDADWFFRVNADSPFAAVELFGPAIELVEDGEVDLVSNVAPRVFPPGATVELIRTEALAALIDGFDETDREHVTQYFYRHADASRRRHLSADGYHVPEGLRLVVDDADDLARARRVVEAMDRPPWSYGLQDIIWRTVEAS